MFTVPHTVGAGTQTPTSVLRWDSPGPHPDCRRVQGALSSATPAPRPSGTGVNKCALLAATAFVVRRHAARGKEFCARPDPPARCEPRPCPELPFPHLQNGRPLLPRGFGDEWVRRGRGLPGPGTGRTGSRGCASARSPRPWPHWICTC